MALTNEGVQRIKQEMRNIENASERAIGVLNKIRGVLNGTDVSVWSSNTEVGKKWVEETEDLLKRVDQITNERFQDLKRDTNQFLDRQMEINRGI